LLLSPAPAQASEDTDTLGTGEEGGEAPNLLPYRATLRQHRAGGPPVAEQLLNLDQVGVFGGSELPVVPDQPDIVGVQLSALFLLCRTGIWRDQRDFTREAGDVFP
jgi:hypothetical protein